MNASIAHGSALDVLRARASHELSERLTDHVARLSWSADRIAEHQRTQVRELLRCAIDRSPFHARRLSGVDPDAFELADLPRLPTMTKAEMMANFDDVVTDRRLSLARVQDHLSKSTCEPSLLLDEFVCLASGGSSGHRGVFVQRLGEIGDFAAALLRPGVARQVAAGGPPPGGLVIAALMASSPVHSSGFGVAVISGPARFVSVPATTPIAEAVEKLNALNAHALMGYPTRLAQLAREQIAGRLRIAPQAVTATSEVFTPEDRALIVRAFGTPVVNQFASTEGLVGHSEPNGAILTFATDMCLVELVDDDNCAVERGAISAKALITNLHNFTQPLIRYELTDRFVRHPDSPGGFLRAEVDGRTDEVFRYGDICIHPLAIRTVMVKTPSVIEYEVRQTECGIDVAVVANGALDVAALARALEESLRAAGLPSPRAHVGAVAALARHAQTGKARRFIPLSS
jgi:phenylacetate-coenzyme A ligase PaaK-like adenylate-forming protein